MAVGGASARTAARSCTGTAATLEHELVVAASTVAIVGLGYVGLPTAIAMASHGQEVVGIDISPVRLDAIARCDVDILDDDLERLRRVIDDGSFVTTGDAAALSAADAVVICAPTPVDRHLVPDSTAVAAACATVVEHARAGQVIVLTSTSYVGTTAGLLVEPLARRGLVAGRDIHVAFSPERIDPGNTVHPQGVVPRVVGATTEESARRAAAVMSLASPNIHTVSSPEAAELTKLHENTFRAVNIAFANEMADIAGRFGLDITEVIDAAATKPYGFMPFRPGAGVGGHCIPCDPHYLLWGLAERKAAAPVIEAAMNQIMLRPGVVVRRAIEALAEHGRSIAGARVLVVGVAYKPGVEDVRESPALELIEDLHARGAKVSFTDPMVASVRVAGRELRRDSDPAARVWDLVVVHGLAPGEDVSWAHDVPVLLDATFRLPAASNRLVP